MVFFSPMLASCNDGYALARLAFSLAIALSFSHDHFLDVSLSHGGLFRYAFSVSHLGNQGFSLDFVCLCFNSIDCVTMLVRLVCFFSCYQPRALTHVLCHDSCIAFISSFCHGKSEGPHHILKCMHREPW